MSQIAFKRALTLKKGKKCTHSGARTSRFSGGQNGFGGEVLSSFEWLIQPTRPHCPFSRYFRGWRQMIFFSRTPIYAMKGNWRIWEKKQFCVSFGGSGSSGSQAQDKQQQHSSKLSEVPEVTQVE